MNIGLYRENNIGLYREIIFLFKLIESLEIEEKLKITIHKSIEDVIEKIKNVA